VLKLWKDPKEKNHQVIKTPKELNRLKLINHQNELERLHSE